jgi:DNA modification methylase
MPVTAQEINEKYAIYNGDCIEVLPMFPDASVHHCLYSPPFAGLWIYSSSERDLSNARSDEEFFEHYEFVVRQIHRLLLPGRISAVHCMDVPKDGANICGYRDFPGDIIRLHEEIGFDYLPRICIWKEPLGVRNRTMIRSLAHRCIVDDSTQSTVAAADYLIPFRKKGKNPIPVAHPVGLLRYAGEREVPGELHEFRGWRGKQTENRYSHWIWRNYASCFWDDIRLGRVLPYEEARDAEDEKHMHPLQLDVIERAVTLWSNPGETVLSPFAGVGSEIYGAVANGRRGLGVELKTTYFRQAKLNLAQALKEAPKETGSLFPAEEAQDKSDADALHTSPFAVVAPSETPPANMVAAGKPCRKKKPTPDADCRENLG